MRQLLLAVAIVCFVAGRAAAQCCGDCNDDGSVTINELIIAVNNALGGCNAPTPTQGPPATNTRKPTATRTPNDRCPFTLTDNSGGRLCGFRGRYNRGCGTDLDSVLATNGTLLSVAVVTMLQNPPVVYFGARVDSATSATLTGWSTDNFQTINPTAGTVQLTDNQSQLVIFPNDPPFMITGCNFVQYTGAFTGSSGSSAAAAAELGDQQGAEGLNRLRAWQERPIPDLAAP